MNLHFDCALQVLDELRCDRADVVDLLVVKLWAKGRLLDGLSGERFAEEVIGDICHLAEDRQVGGALDLQPVRPRLACYKYAYQNV